MGSYLLDQGAILQCQHAGPAQPVTANPRVKLSGRPIVTQTSAYSVAGCSLSGSGTSPCASAQWVSAATRIRAGGQAVLLTNSQAVCTPTGTGLIVVSSQTRVSGQ